MTPGGVLLCMIELHCGRGTTSGHAVSYHTDTPLMSPREQVAGISEPEGERQQGTSTITLVAIQAQLQYIGSREAHDCYA